jgi:hypothetical protein
MTKSKFQGSSVVVAVQRVEKGGQVTIPLEGGLLHTRVVLLCPLLASDQPPNACPLLLRHEERAPVRGGNIDFDVIG